MRILVLSIEYPPLGGGASPMIHTINKQYVQQGHQVTVITMHFGNLPEHEFIDEIEIHRLKCLRSNKHISYFLEHVSFLITARKFIKGYLKQHTVDICHAHFLVPTGLLAMWLKRKYQVPYIVTAHGSDVPGFNPDRFCFLHHFTPPLIRAIARNSLFVVAPSRYLQSLIAQTLGRSIENLIHIPNGIDATYFVPAEKKPIILSTGRLLPRKGFQYLIEAVSDKALPFEVHICGDGPMMNELMEKAKQSLTPVIFHGWLDNKSEEFKELLAEASIFCLVSAKENASTSLLEGLASGCAVITSTVSGCPETVGDAGICIPPADVSALKQQLIYLISNPHILQKYQQEGRARAIKEYSWVKIAQTYWSLFPKADLK